MSDTHTVTPPDLPVEPQQDAAPEAQHEAPRPEGRDAHTGRFVAGNSAARTHGLSSPRIEAALLAEGDAFLSQSIADDGGEGEVPARRRSLHVYRARLHMRIEQMSAALDTHGMFDTRGKLRERWIKRLESLISRAQALDNTLGLARKQRHVNPMDAVRAAVVEANNK